jgi:hypothetical protein
MTTAWAMAARVARPGAVLGRRLKHTLPDLPYDFNALEPVVSAQIMQLHHSKHHQVQPAAVWGCAVGLGLATGAAGFASSLG